jgi:hypothetical protein
MSISVAPVASGFWGLPPIYKYLHNTIQSSNSGGIYFPTTIALYMLNVKFRASNPWNLATMFAGSDERQEC